VQSPGDDLTPERRQAGSSEQLPHAPGPARAVSGAAAAVAVTVLLLGAFVGTYALLGLAGERWLSATDRARGYSLVLPVMTAVFHLALITGIVVLANRKKRS
jgi:hypothetical protein